MKAGIAQINTTVGDLDGNRKLMEQAYGELVGQGVDLVVFPELVISGYPPRDLIFKRRFLEDCRRTLETFADSCQHVPALVGFPMANPGEAGRPAWNAVALCREGTADVVGKKCLLPSYDVFDEDRYFESSSQPGHFKLHGQTVAVTVCEDLWYRLAQGRHHRNEDPVEACASLNPDLVVNLSASPWHWGKIRQREELLQHTAHRCGAPVIYCNAVGGNDELIFDGHSSVVDAGGSIRFRAPGFEENLRMIDLDAFPTDHLDKPPEDSLADLHAALVLGLRDYLKKTGFSSAVVGLSGGIDSALTATLAVDALGPDKVTGISLPSAISSDHSLEDGRQLADNLGIAYHVLPIRSVVAAAESVLGDLFSGLQPDVTEENIQARARGLLLMAVSNKFRSILLTTGNKSEIAVGYCTLYGDMAGGLAVLSDIPKTKVFDLARYLNRDGERIPRSSIEKPPSAELRPDQKDEDSLPPYSVLDEILRAYVEEGMSVAEIAESGYDPDTVREIARKVDLNEYKRKQAAPGLKITPLAFGIGRRIPIVQKYIS